MNASSSKKQITTFLTTLFSTWKYKLVRLDVKTTVAEINQETAKNIYTTLYGADAGFFVDGTSKGINGSGNFIGGTIAGASDYSTLLG